VTAGIKNPFQKPLPKKKNFQASTGDNPLNTEYIENQKGTIRLDGGSYIIALKGTDLDEIPERLGRLFTAVQYANRDTLRRQYGIAICAEEDISRTNGVPEPISGGWRAYRDTAPTHIALPTPHGTLFICAKEENEDEAFRRMGHALHELPVSRILKEQNIQLIVRP
jgi:hypothetical protein